MIGTLLQNRYQIETELGRGAIGIVYRAHDTLLGRDVALKLLGSPGQGSEAAIDTAGRARLLREAQSAAQLNHPNVIAIFDAGEAVLAKSQAAVTFIVMELVPGKSLFEQPAKDLEEILSIGKQIGAALEHAHAHGVIHRDLKPENVLHASPDTIKLTDFGLARSISSRMTLEGMIVGTVFYMAPEIALRQTIDGRADLYSLGVMLYEMVTGQLPFTSDDPLAVISQHLYAPVIPPRALRPEIPSALDALITQLLSKQPQDRPASAAEVRRALEILENLARLGPIQVVPDEDLPLLDRIVRGRLIGRERELKEMDAIWGRTVAGEGRALLVSGEPGIGKTRLVHELVAHATIAGGYALQGNCYAEGGMPYAPIAQIIQEKAGVLDATAALPPTVVADLIKIAPDLRSRYPDLSGEPALDPLSEQQRIFESFVAWCAALAGQGPVLLFLDDAQWADSGTLYLVRHLLRRSGRLRLLVVLTYREIELDQAGPFQQVLHNLIRDRLATRIKLSRFSRQETSEMLASMLTPCGEIADTLAEVIHRETEGNPFFIEEVCKALIEAGRLVFEAGTWYAPDLGSIDIPQSIRVTIQTRLTHLPVPAQDVLRMAAILGREFDFELLRRAADLDEDALIDALEQAEHAQIIQELPQARHQTVTFAFAHALIPMALRDGLSGLRRQRLHRRAAQAIEALHRDNGANLEALASHYEQAGDAVQAQSYYTRAGEQALAVYANPEAERDFRAALEVAQTDEDRARLLAGLGEALIRQSQYFQALEAWLEAVRLFRQLEDHDNLARYYARAARAAGYADDAPRGLSLCLEGLAEVRKLAAGRAVDPAPSIETPGMAMLLHETGRAYRFNNQSEEALPYCRQAMEFAQRLDLVEVQADTLATIGILTSLSSAERRAALEQAVELADKTGLLAIATRAHLNLAGYLEEVSEFGGSRKHALRAAELAHRTGTYTTEFEMTAFAADNAVFLGDFNAAAQDLAELKRLLESMPDLAYGRLTTHLLEAEINQYQGNLDLARKLYEETIPLAQESPGKKILVEIDIRLAEIALEQGQAPDAENLILQVVERLNTKLVQIHMVYPLFIIASAFIQQGKLSQAQETLQKLTHQPFYEGNPLAHGLATWGQARLAWVEGRYDQAGAAFAKGVAITERLGIRWYKARVLLDWAEMGLTRQPPDPVGSLELLDRARRIFAEIQAEGYLRLIQQRLEQLAALPSN